jgi:hypothetical protein
MVAAAELAALQAACLAKLEGSFTLTKRDFPDLLDCASWNSEGASGEVVGFAGEPKIGWVSASVTNGKKGGACTTELTAWVAPAFDLPHLYQVVSLTAGGKLALTLDYISRYDLPADTSYMGEFFLSTLEWHEGVRASDGATDSTVRQDVYLRTIRSPMQLCVEFENSDAGFAAVSKAVENNLARWLGYWEGSKQVNRMKVSSLFVRDTKLHRMRFQSHSDSLKAQGIPLEAAQRIAQAMVGPGDEQYVGLGDGQ